MTHNTSNHKSKQNLEAVETQYQMGSGRSTARGYRGQKFKTPFRNLQQATNTIQLLLALQLKSVSTSRHAYVCTINALWLQLEIVTIHKKQHEKHTLDCSTSGSNIVAKRYIAVFSFFVRLVLFKTFYLCQSQSQK